MQISDSSSVFSYAFLNPFVDACLFFTAYQVRSVIERDEFIFWWLLIFRQIFLLLATIVFNFCNCLHQTNIVSIFLGRTSLLFLSLLFRITNWVNWVVKSESEFSKTNFSARIPISCSVNSGAFLIYIWKEEYIKRSFTNA